MTTLVTGGAGYIGAHVVRSLQERGERVVIVDVRPPDPRRNGDAVYRRLDLLADGASEDVRALIEDEGVDAVIHFAARKRVDESIARPAWYYEQNIGGLATMLMAIDGTGVRRFVFSSSAAVYGSPEESFVTELSPTFPINPYGRTKLVGEWMLDDAVRVQRLGAASLRYFNVAGAGWPDLGDPETLNLVTIVFDRIERGLAPVVFGDDFETPDGSGVRDYVHVVDLARAHIAALDRLEEGSGHRVFNVGTGVGTSVFELLEVVAEVTGHRFDAEVIARRPGDPAAVVARIERISEELGWRAEHDLRSIISSAWQAHRYALDRGRTA